MLKIVAQLAILFLPWELRRPLLVRMFGYGIDPTARIGWSLVLCDRVEMAPLSRVGKFTVVRGLAALTLEEHAHIGNFNWITGFPKHLNSFFADQPDRFPSLHIKHHGALTSRHMVDCTDRLTIGAFTIVGGWHTQILTHSVDVHDNRQRAAPVTIGDYCFVGTRCVLLKGSSVPDYCVVGAGSVVTRRFEETHMLLSGVPAERIQPMAPDIAYFNRTTGDIA